MTHDLVIIIQFRSPDQRDKNMFTKRELLKN